MSVLPGWEERLKATGEESSIRDRYQGLPRLSRYYEKEVCFIDTQEKAVAMAELAGQRPLSHIGIDTEFRYTSPAIPTARNGEWTNTPRYG